MQAARVGSTARVWFSIVLDRRERGGGPSLLGGVESSPGDGGLQRWVVTLPRCGVGGWVNV
jgi:hypothetical protein